MLLRLLIATAIVALGLLVYRGAVAWQRSRARGALKGVDNRLPGRPLILYFTIPGCTPCRTVQGPALQAIQAEWGARLQVITYDVEERGDLAKAWGVLSVPTTLVFSPADRLVAVNPGVAHADKLRRQLSQLERS